MSDDIYFVNPSAFHEILPDGSHRWTYFAAEGPRPPVAEWARAKAGDMVRHLRSGLAGMFYSDPVRRGLMERVLSLPLRMTARELRQRDSLRAAIRRESRRLRRERAMSW